MTDNDNKGPQITADLDSLISELEEGLEVEGFTIHITTKMWHIINTQRTELKQLRAERAGLIEWVESCLIYLDGQSATEASVTLIWALKSIKRLIGLQPALDFDMPSEPTREQLEYLKSKLTDSAQRGEGD